MLFILLSTFVIFFKQESHLVSMRSCLIICSKYVIVSPLTDGSTLFLSVGSYVSPLSQLASGVESLGAVQSITAYLSDNTQLIANPGLRLGVRTDATALYQISDFWKRQHENSDLSKYIIRRYITIMTYISPRHSWIFGSVRLL